MDLDRASLPTINSPLFCFTSDLDWASDYCIRDLVGLVTPFGVKPTLFVTHDTPVTRELEAAGAVELALHPNFGPKSSHGNSVPEVIDSVFRFAPSAESYRSHRFFDSTAISLEMTRRGIRYDSNLCLHKQANIVPLRHGSGLVRYPVFFEDDVNWLHSPGDWSLDIEEFLTPGLKILNFHPFFVAANIPTQDYYSSIKPHIATLNDSTIAQVRHTGEGPRTFLLRLLEALASRKERFYTLKELHQLLHRGNRSVIPDTGRHTLHSEEEYRKYWSLGDREKQEFLKRTYEQRDALDLYATSRDTQVRDLEIAAFRRGFTRPGRVLDVGCGNGLTLLTLAESLEGFDLLGVDFVEKFIKGAVQLRDSRLDRLKSVPRFECADAIAYLKALPSSSVEYVITARFLQNMPSEQVQRELLVEMHRVLTPGGRLLMCEGSEDGFGALNDLRHAVGLDRIPATSADNVSAIRLRDTEMEAYAESLGFSLHSKLGFAHFFIMARVLHPLLVKPQRPRFDARINELAKEIQMQLPFEPGHGSNTLWILEKPTTGSLAVDNAGGEDS
jgi:ubiquinone/menaquinone biosynthesis C-methylase UbiE